MGSQRTLAPDQFADQVGAGGKRPHPSVKQFHPQQPHPQGRQHGEDMVDDHGQIIPAIHHGGGGHAGLRRSQQPERPGQNGGPDGRMQQVGMVQDGNRRVLRAFRQPPHGQWPDALRRHPAVKRHVSRQLRFFHRARICQALKGRKGEKRRHGRGKQDKEHPLDDSAPRPGIHLVDQVLHIGFKW